MIVEAPASAKPVAQAPTVQSVSAWRDCLGLRADWNRLAEHDPDGILLGPDWTAQAWKCSPALRSGEQAQILCLADEQDRPLAILPLRLNRQTRRLCFLEEARSQRLDLLAAPGYASDAWQGMARALRRRRDWDRLDLQFLRPEAATAVYAAFSAQGLAVRPRGMVVQRRILLERPWNVIEADFHTYLRANFRRRLRRLQARGALSLVCHVSPLGLARVLDECFAMERRGWKGSAATAMADDPSLRRFYHQLAFRAAVRGRLRLFCLRVDQHLVAFEYCLFEPGSRRIYSLKIAYDEEFRTASPGAVLRWLLLREHHGQYRVYEFLGDDAAWKAEWTPTTLQLHHLRVYNRTAGGLYWRARAHGNAIKQRLLRSKA